MEHKTPADLITLRRFDTTDLDAFFAWASDDKASRFCRWETYTSKADLLAFITTSVLTHPWFRAICLSGRPVGAISATPIEPHRVELGYVLASEHWGKGIATAAVRAAVPQILEAMADVERVEALVDVENVGSQKVLEKSGFFREGVLRRYAFIKGEVRDVIIYSRLRSDGS